MKGNGIVAGTSRAVIESEAKGPTKGPTDGDAVDRDALIEQIEACTNPWEYLELVRSGFNVSERPQFLVPWSVLVRTRPKLERDQLYVAGKDVWNYSVSTMRKEMDALDKAAGGLSVSTPTVAPEGARFLADAVYGFGQEKQDGFLVYEFNNGDSPVFQQTVEYEGVTYTPPSSTLASLVGFPNGYEDYDGEAGLLREIETYVVKYVQIDSDDFQKLLPVFVLSTWVSDRFDIAMYLRLLGPYASGKTTCERVVGAACRRPFFAVAATAAVIYRVLDALPGITLVLDEADYAKNHPEWSEISRGLCAGTVTHLKVPRCEKDSAGGFDVAAYSTFGPKVLGSREPFADPALESRCLSYTSPLIELKPEIPLFANAEFWRDVQRLQNKLQLWRFRNWSRITADPRQRIPGFDPRTTSLALVLLACIQDPTLRADLQMRLQKYIQSTAVNLRQTSIEAAVAEALVTRWEYGGRSQKRVAMKDVTDVVNQERKYTLTNERVRSIVARILKIKTDRIGGRSWVFPTDTQIRGLVAQYQITPRRTVATLDPEQSSAPATPPETA